MDELGKTNTQFEVFTGPFSFQEIKKAAQLLREKRTNGELQSYISPARKHPDVGHCSSTLFRTEAQVDDIIETHSERIKFKTANHSLQVNDVSCDEVVQDVDEQIQIEEEEEIQIVEENKIQIDEDEEIRIEEDEEIQIVEENKIQIEEDEEIRIEDDEEIRIEENEKENEIREIEGKKETQIGEEEVMQKVTQIEKISTENDNFPIYNVPGKSDVNLACIDRKSTLTCSTKETVLTKPTESIFTSQDLHSDLFTLACISDLAEKLTVSDSTDNKPHVLTTPVQNKTTFFSHLYSPISPADLSSQYLDAVDDSLTEDNKEVQVQSDTTDVAVGFQTNIDSGVEYVEEPVEFHSAMMNSMEGTSTVSIQQRDQRVCETSPSNCETMFHAVSHLKTAEEKCLDVKEASICSSNEICDWSNSSLSCADENISILNDTMDEMDMILNMGVDYFDSDKQNASYHHEKETLATVPNEKIINAYKETKVTHNCITTKFNNDLATACDLENQVVTGTICTTTNTKKVHIDTPRFSSEKLTREHDIVKNAAGKKLFPSPKGLKTPTHYKIVTDKKCASVGNTASVGQSTKSAYFKVPKLTASVGSKTNISKLPKPVHKLKKATITSPVSQYIRGPVGAPRFAVVHPKSLIPAFKLPPKKAETGLNFMQHATDENCSPNVLAVKLPYVDYDTASSIKVVEHKDSKMKPLPSNIQKLMPSPGAVFRHAGRVNIPECVEGLQEVSILVSHDAIH